LQFVPIAYNQRSQAVAVAASWLHDATDLIGGQIFQRLAHAAGPVHFDLFHSLERTPAEMRARIP